MRGSYEFAGRTFDLEKGEIHFTGNSPINPNLDIEASADVTDLSATIHVTGTGLQPDISFTSTPALPEDELLSSQNGRAVGRDSVCQYVSNPVGALYTNT